jgi:hypothetical protein
MPASTALLAQERAVIEGTVTNDSGQPLMSASVFIVGWNLGALSNDSGRFYLVVPAEHVRGQQVELDARLIGYHPRKDTIMVSAGTIHHDFALVPAPMIWPAAPKPSRTDSLTLARGAPLPGCLAIDSDDGNFLQSLRWEVADTDRLSMENKSFASMPTMDSARAEREVVQIEHGPLCAQAQHAMRGAYIHADSVLRKPPTRVRLVRIGHLYFVNDPALSCGEWSSMLTFNDKWELLGSVMR